MHPLCIEKFRALRGGNKSGRESVELSTSLCHQLVKIGMELPAEPLYNAKKCETFLQLYIV